MSLEQIVSKPDIEKGLKSYRLISAATTNATLVKAAKGQVYGWHFSTIDATPVYVKIYDLAVAPTVGTSVPKLTIMVPGNAAGAVSEVSFDQGIEFLNGISFATTTGVADADTGAVAAAEVVINLLYY